LRKFRYVESRSDSRILVRTDENLRVRENRVRPLGAPELRLRPARIGAASVHKHEKQQPLERTRPAERVFDVQPIGSVTRGDRCRHR
jgi:hypothetical protein